MVKESSPKWLLAVCYEWVMYHKDFGRKPLPVGCDRTVRAGGAGRHARMGKTHPRDLLPG